MKTLKKTLCLILAVVMVVGVLILPAHAADDYTTAVTALQNYKVIQGKGDGLPHADDPVTRADMAAIVYRIMTGDTQNPTAANATAATKYGAYAAKYPDAKEASWAIGYIGFCTNQGVLKGDEKGNVKPNEQITGYEVQAMLLRALGYDKNNEYTGKDWKFNILADATKTGISKGVSSDPAGKTLRGAVAQLTYNAATGTDRVAPAVWPNIGYNSLGKKLIEVGKATTAADDWGSKTTTTPFTFTWPDDDKDDSYSTPDKVLYTFYGPVTECDFADLTGVDGTFTTYTNGATNTGKIAIQDTDTINTVGAQGREMIVYKDYIVSKDTVLAVVKSTIPELKDVNGHVTQEATSTLIVYGNNVMEGVDIVNFSKTATAKTAEVTIKGTYAVGTVMTANILTAAGNTLVTDDIELVNATAATAKSVTVNAIIYDGNKTNPTAIGFISTDGIRYLYDVTFGYNRTGSTITTATLSNTDIGKTFGVYTDGRNNVLGIIPAPAASTNYGVVTGYKLVGLGTVTGSNEDYVIEYSILTPNNTTVTVTSANNGVPYDGIANAKNGVVHDVLVSYKPNAINSKYYDVTKATATKDRGKLESGHANAGLTPNNYLLNDKTVIFVANYTMSNSKGGYVFTNYSIYKGFKTIPDLANNGKKIFASTSDITGTTPTNLTITAFGHTTTDGRNYADYALVLYANEQSTDTVEAVPSYAYIQYDLQQSDVYDNYVEYNALLNGKQDTLKVASDKNAADVIEKGGSGLYIYDKSTNGAFGKIVGPVNVIENKNWSYYAGVLSAKASIPLNGGSETKNYLTVADGAVVYIVNPTTGKVTTATYDLSILNDANLYNKATLYFQLNQYGWIDLIYLVDNMEDPTTPTTATTCDITYVVNIVDPRSGKIIETVKKTQEKVNPGLDYFTTWQSVAAYVGLEDPATNLALYGVLPGNGKTVAGVNVTLTFNVYYK